MSAIGSKLRAMADGLVAFWCPGCDEAHTVRPRPAASPSWEFNGDGDRPTFAPSILVTGTQRLTDDEHARVMRGEPSAMATRIAASIAPSSRAAGRRTASKARAKIRDRASRTVQCRKGGCGFRDG